MPELTKVRKQFLTRIFVLIVSLRGRMNFLNMGGRHIFREKLPSSFWQPLGYFAFNKHLIEGFCSGHRIIAIDCCYIPKSGKETPHIGKFWSGWPQKHVKGLK
jgi:hypothetical protein